MSVQLRWNGHLLSLQLNRQSDGLAMVYNGTQHSVGAARPSGESLELAIDGVVHRCRMYTEKDSIWISGPAGIYRFERVDETVSSGNDVDTGTSALISRMPGRVLRRAVDPGARVVRGQTLIVLEAMKMEYEVTAPADGLVESFPQEEGAPIMPGDLLVEFVPDMTGNAGL
jgi:acetyl/propionyl-CoA carboxylase alpha subunit